jgi:hypothetical protein
MLPTNPLALNDVTNVADFGAIIKANTKQQLSAVRRLNFFQSPVVPAIRMAMAMCGEKSAAIFPKPRPDLFAIGLWNLERIDFGP